MPIGAPYDPLIDITYFSLENTVGQSEQLHVREVVDGFIRKYEFEFLQKLMGMSLFNATYTGLKGGTLNARWQAMAYGKSFHLDHSKVKCFHRCSPMGRVEIIPNLSCYCDEVAVNYTGLIEKTITSNTTAFLYDGYNIASPIANYVYYYYMKNKATSTVGSGEIVSKTQNADTVNAGGKMIKEWNEMCDWCVNFYLFLDQHIADYPEYDLPVQSRFYPKKMNQFNLDV
jgi:hypothetical protein